MMPTKAHYAPRVDRNTDIPFNPTYAHLSTSEAIRAVLKSYGSLNLLKLVNFIYDSNFLQENKLVASAAANRVRQIANQLARKGDVVKNGNMFSISTLETPAPENTSDGIWLVKRWKFLSASKFSRQETVISAHLSKTKACYNAKFLADSDGYRSASFDGTIYSAQLSVTNFEDNWKLDKGVMVVHLPISE